MTTTRNLSLAGAVPFNLVVGGAALIGYKEEWRDVPNLEPYQASTLGRIRNKATGTIRKQNLNSSGYWHVMYRTPGSRKTKCMLVHRAVALAFLGKSDLYVNHLDGNKLNNLLGNLEWCSRKQNMKHAFSTGLVAFGEERKNAKLTLTKAREIRAKYRPRTYSQYKLAREYGVSQGAIDRVVNNETWREEYAQARGR